MKHIKQFEARKLKRTIMPISDFLVDTFFGNSVFNVLTNERYNKNLRIEIHFKFYDPMKLEYFDMIKNFVNFITPYTSKLKYQFFGFNELQIFINLQLDKAKEIKSLLQFKKWEEKNIEEHELYMIKIDAKKYNL